LAGAHRSGVHPGGTNPSRSRQPAWLRGNRPTAAASSRTASGCSQRYTPAPKLAARRRPG
jgi:hypothetical protein